MRPSCCPRGCRCTCPGSRRSCGSQPRRGCPGLTLLPGLVGLREVRQHEDLCAAVCDARCKRCCRRCSGRAR
eukprot:2407263-Alexandrium_andersonii.AAC.1